MKQILYGLAAMILMLPVFLIFAEDAPQMNLIGITYVGLLTCLTKYTKKGRKIAVKFYRNLK